MSKGRRFPLNLQEGQAGVSEISLQVEKELQELSHFLSSSGFLLLKRKSWLASFDFGGSLTRRELISSSNELLMRADPRSFVSWGGATPTVSNESDAQDTKTYKGYGKKFLTFSPACS